MSDGCLPPCPVLQSSVAAMYKLYLLPAILSCTLVQRS